MRADLHRHGWRQKWTPRDTDPSVRILLLQGEDRAIRLVIQGHYGLIIAIDDLADNRLAHVILVFVCRNAHAIGRRRRNDSEWIGRDEQRFAAWNAVFDHPESQSQTIKPRWIRPLPGVQRDLDLLIRKDIGRPWREDERARADIIPAIFILNLQLNDRAI